MSKELKIGIFAVTVLVASFFLINYLRGKDIFNREMELTSRFENVQGLVASAPVHIKGYKAGKVTEVIYEPETEDFKVTCAISRDFRIPEDSKMTIYSVDIMGGKGVKIDLGTSQTAAEDGDMLNPQFETGLMDGLAESITPLMTKVNTLLDSLNVTVSGVNRVLADENQEKLTGILAHLEDTMSDLNRLSAAVGGKSAEIEEVIDNVANLSAKFGDIADQVDTTLAGVNDFVDTINASDVESLVVSVKNLLENINDPDGTVGRLLSDDSVYNSVDSLISDIDVLVKKIQENPKKYIRISVF
jgi:phospholipid/cholesterol/gamma-HCH transport system substrate-binding protein